MLERERLLAQSRASNTHSTYLKAWESFQNFRLTYKFSLNEAPTIEHLVNYIPSLSLKLSLLRLSPSGRVYGACARPRPHTSIDRC